MMTRGRGGGIDTPKSDEVIYEQPLILIILIVVVAILIIMG